MKLTTTTSTSSGMRTDVLAGVVTNLADQEDSSYVATHRLWAKRRFV